jgi:hypothetical protein
LRGEGFYDQRRVCHDKPDFDQAQVQRNILFCETDFKFPDVICKKGLHLFPGKGMPWHHFRIRFLFCILKVEEASEDMLKIQTGGFKLSPEDRNRFFNSKPV